MAMRILTARVIALLAALVMPLAVAQAQPPAPPPAKAASTADVANMALTDGYVLGVGDMIEVSVLGSAEPPVRVQIQADGTAQLPLLGAIKASDISVLKLRDQIRQRYKSSGYYTDPLVNLNIVSYASRYVIVLGEVGSPGIVPIDRAYRVSEILARVGGARQTGADSVTLTRASGEQLTLSVQEMATGGADKDPMVNAGDKLYIPKADTFYIYGQVNAPGTYAVDRGMTMRMALARGGGLASMGSEKRIKIFRSGTEIKNFDPSNAIKGGDVIVVGERFF